MLVFQDESLVPIGYTDSDFQSDRESRKSTSGYVFTLGGGAISWRSVKRSSIADSTMEAEYIAVSEAAKEAVWQKNFLLDLEGFFSEVCCCIKNSEEEEQGAHIFLQEAGAYNRRLRGTSTRIFYFFFSRSLFSNKELLFQFRKRYKPSQQGLQR